MAISYNTGTTAHVSASGTASGTVTIPAGVLSGDTVLVLVSLFTTDAGTLSLGLSSTGTTPAAQGASQLAASGGIQVIGQVFSIAAGASDPSATLTYSASGTTGGSYWWNVGLVSYTGAGSVDVIQGAEFFNASSTGTTTTPSATTVTSGDWQVQLLGVAPPNGANFTVPGTLTGRQSITSAANAGILLQIADSNASVGAGGTGIGNTTWTCSGAAASNTWSTSFTVGLSPAGGGGGAPPVLPGRPGKTWLRRYHHRQQPQSPPPGSPATGATAAPAAVAAAAVAPSTAVTVNAGVAAAAAGAPGATQGVYRIWPSTNGPASATANSGNFICGTVFGVKGGGNWFTGYWWWVAASGGQSTAATKCALWAVGVNGAGTLVSGSVVTSGTLTAGQWNFIPLSTPIQLAPSYDPGDSTTGGCYIAAITSNAGPFPDTTGYWGGAGAGAAGIINGPLVAYSAQSGSSGSLGSPWTQPQGTFSTGGNDPSVTMPNQQSNVDNFWVDVQISTTTPSAYSGSYRLWPNKTDANSSIAGDAAVNYTIATEIDLTAACVLDNTWFYSPSGSVNLPTRCDVWNISTGLSAASITSPSWSGAAGSGWVSAAFAGGTTLPAGSYRVSVYDSNGTAGTWSAKDASTNYWGQGGTGGVGSNGITWGPLSAPSQPNAASGWTYNAANSGATPPYSSGTAINAQPPFGQLPSGLVDFPQLYAPVGAGTNQTQNYWVDLEVTPVASGTAATIAPVVSVTAPAPTVAVTASAGVATVAAAAPATASTAVTVTAGAPVVLAAVTAPATAETVTAGVSIIDAAATPATVNTSGSTTATAGVAAVSALAVAPTTAVTFTAGVAAAQALVTAPVAAPAALAGVGTVLVAGTAATVSTVGGTVANAPAATVSAVARPVASLTLTATAQAASVLTAGVQVRPPLVVARSTTTVTVTDTSTATVSGATSITMVTDPRDGTAGVT